MSFEDLAFNEVDVHCRNWLFFSGIVIESQLAPRMLLGCLLEDVDEVQKGHLEVFQLYFVATYNPLHELQSFLLQ